MTKKIHLLFALSVSLLLTSCATQVKNNSDSGSQATVYKYEVFFGLSKPKGGTVSIAEWNAFEANTISPKFSDGFTIYDGSGFYEGKTERTKVLALIVNADDAVASLRKIKEISRAYVAQFDQDSVMLIKVPVLKWDFIKLSDK